MEFFDGNFHAKELDKKISEFLTIKSATEKDLEKELAIILVGDNPSSQKYVSIKEKLGQKLGVCVKVYWFNPAEMSSLEMLVRGSDIIYSPNVKSVIVQLPLPVERLYSLLTKIPYEKDVDMLSEGSKKKFFNGDFSLLSPVVRAVEYFLESNNLILEGKKATVIGDGELVGKPVAFYLSKKGAEVEIINNYKTGEKINSDFIVVCAGVPNLVDGNDISEGCHVIDYGSSVLDGKVVGDLNLESRLEHLGFVSPSPGGMGPLVVRFLFMNHLGM